MTAKLTAETALNCPDPPTMPRWRTTRHQNREGLAEPPFALVMTAHREQAFPSRASRVPQAKYRPAGLWDNP